MHRWLRRLVLRGRKHTHVALATERPRGTNLARLYDFVMLEWVEIVFDMDRPLLDDLGAKEWIGRGR